MEKHIDRSDKLLSPHRFRKKRNIEASVKSHRDDTRIPSKQLLIECTMFSSG